MGQVISSGDITQLGGRPSGFFSITPGVSGMPYDGNYWRVQSLSTAPSENNKGPTWLQAVSAGVASEAYSRVCASGIWGNWVRLATAEQPTILDLPLSNGFVSIHTNGCRYWKTQEGIVTVDAHILKNDGIITNTEVLAVLPEGFRPSDIETIERPALYRTPFTPGFVQITKFGEFRARHDGSNINVISFHISFPTQ